MAERLGSPPSHFGVQPILKRLPRHARLFRIYFQGGAHPVQWNEFRFFGPTRSRFDHHTRPKRLQARGIIYVTRGGDAILTALAEVFQDSRHIDRTRSSPWLAAFDIEDPLPLLDTGSKWPIRAGGNMAINSGPRGRARDWSRGIYRQYQDVEGIWYPSSLTNQACGALYERALHALPTRPQLNLPLNHPDLLPNLTRFAVQLNYSIS